MYSITYKTRRGGSGVMTSLAFGDIEKKLVSLFKQRLEATTYKDGVLIGKVWKDNSQRLGWNYLIEQ